MLTLNSSLALGELYVRAFNTILEYKMISAFRFPSVIQPLRISGRATSRWTHYIKKVPKHGLRMYIKYKQKTTKSRNCQLNSVFRIVLFWVGLVFLLVGRLGGCIACVGTILAVAPGILDEGSDGSGTRHLHFGSVMKNLVYALVTARLQRVASARRRASTTN